MARNYDKGADGPESVQIREINFLSHGCPGVYFRAIKTMEQDTILNRKRVVNTQKVTHLIISIPLCSKFGNLDVFN